MKDKYLAIFWERTKDERSGEEIAYIKNYYALDYEEAAVDFLFTCALAFLEEDREERFYPKVDLYEFVDENYLKVYESFVWNKSHRLEDLFEKIELISEEDDRQQLFFTLMAMTGEKKEKKFYQMIVVKDKIEDDKIIRDVVGVYHPEDEEEAVKLLKGSVGKSALSDNLLAVIYNKLEKTEVYLYEWAEDLPELCTEYKTMVVNEDGVRVDDFFEHKSEKQIELTMLVFKDYLKS